MIDRNTPPAIQNIDHIQILPLGSTTLTNQFKLHYLHASESEIIQLSFVFHAGRVHQTKKCLIDALSGLITSGTLNHSAKEIAEMLEYYGVFYSVKPFATHLKIQFTLLKKNIKDALPIIEEIIKYANFPQDEIAIFQKTSIEQYQTQIKNVSTLASWHFSKLIYGHEHPLNKLHTPEDYQNITRDDLLAVYTTHIHPKNGFMFVSGNIDDTFISALNASFGMEDFHQSQYLFDKHVPPIQSFEDHVYIQIPDALQSAIYIGNAIPLYYPHTDYFDFVIANTLLGGYFGSRLMSVIREEKGYTYGIYSSLSAHNDYSIFFITSEVKSEHTQAAIDEIIHQIEILQNQPPDEYELEIVKNYLAGELLSITDGVLNQDNTWQSILTRDLPHDYYHQLLRRIQDISAESIRSVMKKYIDVKQLKKCIVGKF